jgi:HK97 family phage major capsid protein
MAAGWDPAPKRSNRRQKMEATRSLLQKADLALADLISDGGYLEPAQAQQFIRVMIKKAKLSGMVTVTPLDAPRQHIETLRFAGQVLQPGTPGVALPEAQRSKPDLGQTTWDAQFFKSEVRLNNATLEQSIERGNLKNTIMSALSEAVGRDAEKVIIQGDTSSTDPLLAVLDGILVKATSNTVDGASGRLDSDLLDEMLRSLPKEFVDDIGNMAYLTSVNAQLDYNKELAARGTGLGDAQLANGETPKYHKIPVVDFTLWPETGFTGTDETNVLLAAPKNINYGIWKQIRIDTGKDVSAGVVIIVVETWFDVVFTEETAVVKAYDVLNS